MLAVDKKVLMFKHREVHFSNQPHDIKNCDYLRFHSCKKRVNIDGFKRKKGFTSVIDLTQDLDTIWNNFDKKSTKYGIRRAEREGITIRKNEKYEEFLEMYNSFLKQRGIKSFLEIFGIKNLTVKDLKKYGTLMVAEYAGEVIAGSLYLEDESHIEAWIGGSKRLESDKKKKILSACANRLIDWEVIKYAKEKGIKEFDLGGLWSEEEANNDISKKGINNFKLSFGGKTVTRYSYEKIYSKTYRLACYLYGIKKLVKNET